MSRKPQLSPEQAAEAQRIFLILKLTADDDLLAFARRSAALVKTQDHDLAADAAVGIQRDARAYRLRSRGKEPEP
jgi:hypothetical protein